MIPDATTTTTTCSSGLGLWGLWVVGVVSGAAWEGGRGQWGRGRGRAGCDPGFGGVGRGEERLEGVSERVILLPFLEIDHRKEKLLHYEEILTWINYENMKLFLSAITFF